MKTVFVYLLLVVLTPANPKYQEFASVSEVPYMYMVEPVETDAECQAWKDQTAAMLKKQAEQPKFYVLQERCFEVTYIIGKTL